MMATMMHDPNLPFLIMGGSDHEDSVQWPEISLIKVWKVLLCPFLD